MILEAKSNYLFKICEHFDVCYYNQNFVVKSRYYDFSTTIAINSEQLLSLLKSFKYKGVVLFDLLMSNGLHADNRFIECYFNGETFEWKKIKVAPVKRVDIHNEYYRNKNNIELKKGSILSSGEVKELLTK